MSGNTRPKGHLETRLLVVVATTIALVAPPSWASRVTGDWPQFHFGPEHLGYNPFETLLDPTTVQTLQEQWMAPVSGAIGVVTSDGTVYVTGNSQGDVPRAVYALDGGTGNVTWSRDMGRVVSAPVVDGGRVFMVHKMCRNRPRTCSRKLTALDATTGSLAWRTLLPGTFASVSFPSPTLVGGTVYTTSGTYLIAADEANGTISWSATLAGGSSAASPSVAGNVVYVDAGTHVSAFDATSGVLVWDTSVTDSLAGSVVVDGSVLFVGTTGGDVLALDGATGGQLWRDDSAFGTATTPSVGDGIVSVAGGSGLAAFDEVGVTNCAGVPKVCSPVWTGQLSGATSSSPDAANGVVYTDAAAWGAEDGTLLWNGYGHFDTTPPVVSQGHLYVCDASSVHAYAP